MSEIVPAVDISKIDQYAKKYQRKLIQLAVGFNELTQNCSVLAGVKDKEVMTELEFKSLIKPYADKWNPDEDKALLIPRTVEVEVGQVELEENPIKYRKTYLGQIMKTGVNPNDHPFEKDFLEGIVKRINNDIVFVAAFYGNKALRQSGTTEQKKSVISVNDGFFTILNKEITEGNVSEVKKNLIPTGVIDKTNAVEKLKSFYRTAANHQPAVRSKPTRLYCSYDIYDAYCDNYQATNEALPYNQKFEHVVLEGSAGLCTLTPMSGMRNSKRIILTEEWNMKYAVDTLSDQEKIEVWKPNPKVMGFLSLMAFGFQFVTLNALWTNEKELDEESGSPSTSQSGSVSVSE